MDGKDCPADRLDALRERIRRRMLGLFGRQAWIEDVVQTAMETLVRKESAFRGEGPLESFADAIALNAARDAMRRERRAAILLDIVADQGPWPAVPPCPADQAEDRDRLGRLELILVRIHPDHRIAWLLYNVEGRTVPEIAGIVGASEAAIRKRIERAGIDIRARARRDPVLAEWLATLGGEE